MAQEKYQNRFRTFHGSGASELRARRGPTTTNKEQQQPRRTNMDKLNSWSLWEERNRQQRPKMDEEMMDAAVRDISIVYQEVKSRFEAQSAQIVDVIVKLGQAADEITDMKNKLDRNDKELKDALLANDQQFKGNVEQAIGQAGQATKDTGAAAAQANAAATLANVATEDTKAALAQVSSEVGKVSQDNVGKAFGDVQGRIALIEQGITETINGLKQTMSNDFGQKIEEVKNELERKIGGAAVTRTFGAPGTSFQEHHKRGILDSKVWDGLKMFDTDKVVCKEWTVKLRNKYCQVRTGLDVGKSWDELEDLALWASTLTERTTG